MVVLLLPCLGTVIFPLQEVLHPAMLVYASNQLLYWPKIQPGLLLGLALAPVIPPSAMTYSAKGMGSTSTTTLPCFVSLLSESLLTGFTRQEW